MGHSGVAGYGLGGLCPGWSLGSPGDPSSPQDPFQTPELGKCWVQGEGY